MASFGRYTLLRRVGIGGMAEIWKAKVTGPEGFSKTIAIKKVLPHLSEDKVFLRMFIEEAKLVASLVHPNVVQVFDFGEATPGSREFYIAMEYVAGANLAEVLIRLQEISFKLSPELALYVTLEACKGLGYAHHMTDEVGTPMSIVHRDVSPQNVLISYGGEVKITDFGIAKIESAISHTAEGQVRGKLAYMSPEQAAGKQIDGRSDLFSLGVMLYELMTGRRLFQGNSGAEIYTQVVSFTSLDQATISDIPLRYQALLGSVLQADPEKRIRNAQELELALTHALGPGVAIARVSLAELVQRLFAEERAIEMQPVPSESVEVQEPMKMGGIFTSGEDLERLEEKTLTSPAANQPSHPQDSLAEDYQSGTVVAKAAQGDPPTLPAGRVLPPEDDDDDEDHDTNEKEDGPFAGHLADKPTEKDYTKPAPSASRLKPGGNNALQRMGMLAAVCVAGILLTWKPWQSSGAPTATATAAHTQVAQTANPSPTFSVLPLLADEDTPVPVKPTPAPTHAPRTPVAVATSAPATPRPTHTPSQVAEETPAVKPTPVAKATVKQTPVVVANNSGGSATLSVAARPWVQVWVDGKQVATETPLRNYAIASGAHNLRFVNPAVNFDVQKAVNIPRDGKTSVFVDVPSGNVRVTE